MPTAALARKQGRTRTGRLPDGWFPSAGSGWPDMSLSLGLALMAFAVSCAIAWLLHRFSNPNHPVRTRHKYLWPFRHPLP